MPQPYAQVTYTVFYVLYVLYNMSRPFLFKNTCKVNLFSQLASFDYTCFLIIFSQFFASYRHIHPCHIKVIVNQHHLAPGWTSNAWSLGKTVENPAFVIAEIAVNMIHFWNQLDESFILTFDVKMIGSSFLRKIFWKRYKNRYFFTDRALEF